MQHDATDDPLRSMVVDRVVRDDGRYLIYYGWPDADRTQEASADTDDHPTAPDPGTVDV